MPPLKPHIKPKDPRFSCGPVKKFPGWSYQSLDQAVLGYSHRSPACKKRIQKALRETHDLLQLPKGYRVALVPGGDTGAMELALWNLLGVRGVDVAAWERFGFEWVHDICRELRLEDVRVFEAGYGDLPDLTHISPDRDFVFTWNGTVSGVRVPNADFISAERQGLVICDATSSAFAQDMDWEKLDIITYSWQKVMGGEGEHGILIASPRALERMRTYTPPWPVPKLFRLREKGEFKDNLFEGAVINTPSMMCVEDYLAALQWARDEGGLEALIARTDRNMAALDVWVQETPWIDYACTNPFWRSNTSVCLKFTDPRLNKAGAEFEHHLMQKMESLLEEENVAFDISAYRLAPPGLRIWCGPTIETEDIKALTPWLDWSFYTVLSSMTLAA